MNRSFYEKKPFFLWEKAVLSMGKSRSFFWDNSVGIFTCLILLDGSGQQFVKSA